MPEESKNGNPNPYSSKNIELEKTMDAAVGKAIGDVTLPCAYENANGENGNNVEDEGSWIRRVADLEGKVFRLDDELKSLKEKSVIAFCFFQITQQLPIFEENLALYLYPRGRVFGRNQIFSGLMRWMDLRRDTPQGAVAVNRWLQVQREVGWSQHHEEVLRKFRDLPPVPTTVEALEMWNPIPLTEVENRCIDDIRRLSETLSQWIENEENERENK